MLGVNPPLHHLQSLAEGGYSRTLIDHLSSVMQVIGRETQTFVETEVQLRISPKGKRDPQNNQGHGILFGILYVFMHAGG